jgi:hypothetical protein
MDTPEGSKRFTKLPPFYGVIYILVSHPAVSPPNLKSSKKICARSTGVSVSQDKDQAEREHSSTEIRKKSQRNGRLCVERSSFDLAFFTERNAVALPRNDASSLMRRVRVS